MIIGFVPHRNFYLALYFSASFDARDYANYMRWDPRSIPRQDDAPRSGKKVIHSSILLDNLFAYYISKIDFSFPTFIMT